MKHFWSLYRKKPVRGPSLPKSRRPHEIDLESIVRMRKKVLKIIIFLIIIFLIYLFGYSDKFRIQNINITGQSSEVSNEEIKSNIERAISGSRYILLPGNNYFFVNLEAVQRYFDQNNLFIELEIDKDFPRTLNVQVKEKLGRLIWISAEQLYLLELDGRVKSQLNARELVNVGIPVVYDSSNSLFDFDQEFVNDQLIALIVEIFTTFDSYELPIIQYDYFKVDSPEANYIKLVTKQGFEIHLNYLSSVSSQLRKLKLSLLEGKIDLSKINYINLRIKNQVIFK